MALWLLSLCAGAGICRVLGPGLGSVPRSSSFLLGFSCIFPLGILFTNEGDEIDNKNPQLISDILIAHSKF
jgi:hypothetical protein